MVARARKYNEDYEKYRTNLKREQKEDARWGLLWRSNTKLDGYREHLLRAWHSKDDDHNCDPLLFKTRREAREYNNREYGYLKKRADVRDYGWKVPKVVKMLAVYHYAAG